MEGGADFNTYIAGIGDTIKDDTDNQGYGSLTIENWNPTTKEALGIKLEKSKAIDISVGDASNFEATGNIITVPAQPEYKYYDSYHGTWIVHPAQAAYTYPEQRTIVTGQQFNIVGTVTFDPGDQEKTYTYTWKDNDFVGVHTGRPNPLTLVPKTNETLSHYGDDITQLSNNNYFKQNTFTCISKSDTINN